MPFVNGRAGLLREAHQEDRSGRGKRQPNTGENLDGAS